MADSDKKTSGSWSLVVFIVMAGLIALAGYFTTGSATATRTYSEFLADLEAGRFTEVEVSGSRLVGTFSSPTTTGESLAIAVRPPNLDDPRLMQLLTEKKVSVKGQVTEGT